MRYRLNNICCRFCKDEEVHLKYFNSAKNDASLQNFCNQAKSLSESNVLVTLFA